MVLTSNWLIIIVLLIKCLLIQGKTFHVSNFGAYPNDDIDDTREIQSAINTAINYGLNSTIVFGYGTYNLSAPITIINATNLTIQGQGIDQTFLIGNVPITIFWVVFGTGVTIRSLSIDFDPLSFTAGYVVNVNDAYIDVRVQPPHRADVGRQIKFIIRYDLVEMRPAFGPNTYAFYPPAINVSTTLVSENVLRMPFAVPSNFVVGDAVVAHFINPNDTIFVYGTVDFTIQSITMYTSWAMGLFTMKIRRFNIIDFHIVPRNGRWLSSPSDCIHVVSSREYVNVIDSTCQATGDDGLNVFRPFIAIVEVVDSRTIVVKTGGTTDPYIQVGEHIEFTSKTQPFTVYATGMVVASAPVGSNVRILIFNISINASIGDWICNVDLPSLTIRNFTVHSNRARGIVLETRNIDVRNSVFNRTSAPAIIIQPSLNYYEGPEARNVTLSHNLFINCNEGIGQQQGIIALVPDPIQLVPVINDIIIESSSFYYRNYSEHLLESFNVNNLVFRNNYIATNLTTPVVQLCNTRNITASNNTVVNIHGKLEQYYGFEGRHGCQLNLTSLIDLPPSAFNSSFPPPV
jgi:hypothetical protein